LTKLFEEEEQQHNNFCCEAGITMATDHAAQILHKQHCHQVPIYTIVFKYGQNTCMNYWGKLLCFLNAFGLLESCISGPYSYNYLDNKLDAVTHKS